MPAPAGERSGTRTVHLLVGRGLGVLGRCGSAAGIARRNR